MERARNGKMEETCWKTSENNGKLMKTAGKTMKKQGGQPRTKKTKLPKKKMPNSFRALIEVSGSEAHELKAIQILLQ